MLDRLEDQPGRLHGEPRDHDNQQHRKQFRDGANHRLGELREPFEQESAQRLAPGPGVREAPEHEGQPPVGDQQPRGGTQNRHQSAKQTWQARGSHDLATRQTLQLPIRGTGRPGHGPALAPHQQAA
jgi:hypothetical protein